jgi:abequosyltransferase
MTNYSSKKQDSQYLLTIAIPTYNRSKYLNLCLAQIGNQFHGNEQIIELLVSDNNSTDNTEEIVQKYISQGYPIKYVKNKQNIGPDHNFLQCFNLAKGKYVLIFGDDDTLADGVINLILNILRKSNYGIVHLSTRHKNGFATKITTILSGKKNYDYAIYDNTKEFIKDVNYSFGFISGNIVNKTLVDKTIDMEQFAETNLMQLGWTLSAVFNVKQNIVIEDAIIATNLVGGATGEGCLWCRILSVNQNKIFDTFIKRGIDKKYFDIINRKLLQRFFPQAILDIRKNRKQNKESKELMKEDFYKVLYPIYHNSLFFWVFTVPAIKLPLPAAIFWFIIIRITSRINILKKRIGIKFGFTRNVIYHKVNAC